LAAFAESVWITVCHEHINKEGGVELCKR